jgi:hypothetical protein
MQIITTTDALAAFCARAATHPFVTVDTEFLRERTYYSKLCLVQLAHPGDEPEAGAVVDPLVEGLSLEPLYDLFRDPKVVKVFHAARQDLEIFQVEADVIPAPLFDTQVAAMVCGYGEQVSYETLVRRIARAEIDKSSRFTDWSRRPLSEAQLAYALDDVTHLRTIYVALSERLARTGREPWVAAEMAVLMDPATYRTDPGRGVDAHQDPPRLAQDDGRPGRARALPRGVRAVARRAPLARPQGRRPPGARLDAPPDRGRPRQVPPPPSRGAARRHCRRHPRRHPAGGQAASRGPAALGRARAGAGEPRASPTSCASSSRRARTPRASRPSSSPRRRTSTPSRLAGATWRPCAAGAPRSSGTTR